MLAPAPSQGSVSRRPRRRRRPPTVLRHPVACPFSSALRSLRCDLTSTAHPEVEVDHPLAWVNDMLALLLIDGQRASQRDGLHLRREEGRGIAVRFAGGR